MKLLCQVLDCVVFLCVIICNVLLYDVMIIDMCEGFYMLGLFDIDEYDLVDFVDILILLGKLIFWDGVVSIQLRG